MDSKSYELLSFGKTKYDRVVITDIHGTLNIFTNMKTCGDMDILLENAELSMVENGNLRITGDMIDFDWLGSKAHHEYFDYEKLKLSDKYILDDRFIVDRRCKFLFWEIGKVYYAGGWTRLKKKGSFDVITNNYRITTIKHEDSQ